MRRAQNGRTKKGRKGSLSGSNYRLIHGVRGQSSAHFFFYPPLKKTSMTLWGRNRCGFRTREAPHARVYEMSVCLSVCLFRANTALEKQRKPAIPCGTTGFWSCWADSNRRPHPYQGCALPTELQQHTRGSRRSLFKKALAYLLQWRPRTGSNRRPPA